MLEFPKNLFGKLVEGWSNKRRDSAPPKASTPQKAPSPPPSQKPPPRSEPEPVLYSSNGDDLCLPFQAILNALPNELKDRIKHADVGDLTFSISMEKVITQLSRGVVKVSFGELREAAPEVFSTRNDRDQVQLVLPLNEILARINPALLPRRQDQKLIAVPEDVSSPFGNRGQGLIFAAGQTKAQPAAATPTRGVTPAKPQAAAAAPPAAPVQMPSARTTTPIQPEPAPVRSTLQSAPTPPPPAAPSLAAAPAIPVTPALRNLMSATPAAPRQPVTSRQTAAPQQPPAAPREAVPAPGKPADEADSLCVLLKALSGSWPDALRTEIVQLQLSDAKVVLPADVFDQALKQGKVTFTWKVVRSWIKPALPATPSVHDSMTVELPLKVLAPLFLMRQRSTAVKSPQKTERDQRIPNLSTNVPKPAPPAAATPPAPVRAAAKPAAVNDDAWDDTAGAPKVDGAAKRKMPGLDQIARYTTPNEIVTRAAALKGVAGVLVALPDGLMVANKLPGDLNSQTLAAFLPHIFSKVNQCAKELHMGDLCALNFTVGHTPWIIINANTIFFAAFGRPGEPLPSVQLTALAADLDQKNQ
jgi:predicted regulator of Ras-like GTPase activity (Roadblock/LC7/MglB family)